VFEITGKRLNKLRNALARLAMPSRRWVSLDFFSDSEITALRHLANAQTFRTAQSEIVHRKNRVFQDFDVCFPAPRIGAFEDLAAELEAGLFAAGASLANNPFETRFQFDDFAIQRYPPGSRGIGIHRDGKRYKNIVVIITLAGQSRLFSSASRTGETRKRINDRPGRLVLLSADGFAGRYNEESRPLHGVDCVRGGRLSIGLRAFG
jgi:hypothetical protein